MSNLFSVFDPVSWFSLNLNWLSSLLVILFLPPGFWLTKNQIKSFILNISLIIKKEFAATLNRFSIPGFLTISLSLFFFVIINNVPGLIPYIFTASRHPTFTLTLALPFWLGHILMGAIKVYNPILAHLVPLSTPSFLVPFIVVVEIISRIIRPLTLAVRLAANIIAGHLLIALLGGITSGPSRALFFIIMGLVALFLLELAVSLIQAYVFRVLSTLFINEVNLPQINSY